MDAFYAAVEVLDNPALGGRPVIVGGISNRGVVSAASYEARVFGVHSAMPIFHAKRLCPHGIYLPPRFQRYREVSRVVMNILLGYSPLVEQVSIDEAFIDLTGSRQLFGGPAKMARSIKRSIRQETELTCSLGLANCKFIAKVASDMDKPDGLVIVRPSEVRAFLDALPIGRVPGIGKKSREQLSVLGVAKLGQIRRLSPMMLRERFGKYGDWLQRVANGVDDSPVVTYTQPKSISAELTLEENTKDVRTLKKHLKQQSERVARRLRKHHFKGRTVTLKLKYADFKLITRSVTLERPTCTGKTIFTEAVELLLSRGLRAKVRLVGIGVSNLEGGEETGQIALFEDRSRSEKKWEKAEKAVDEIVKCFGEGAVKPGTLLE
jgi:DNA polymerase-4